VQLTRHEWLLLLVLGAVQFTHIIDFMIIMPLEPEYMRLLHISPLQFGFLVFAYAMSAAVSGLLAARFIDRFDRKTALMVLYTGFAAGTFLCAVAPDYPLLVLARTVAGAFGGVAGSCILAIIGDVFPDVRRGSATGVVMSAFSVASILGLPIGLYLANLLGWRAPFAVLSGLALPVLALIYLVLPHLRGHMGKAPQSANAHLWAVLTEPTHVRSYLLMTALVMSTMMVVPHMGAYLVGNAGCRQADLPFIYFFGGIASLLTLTPIGRWADRRGKLMVFRLMALLTIIPLVLLTNLPPVPLATVIAITTLLMVVSGGRMVPAMALMTASAAPHHRGSFLSVNSSVQQIALGLAAVASGALLGTEAAHMEPTTLAANLWSLAAQSPGQQSLGAGPAACLLGLAESVCPAANGQSEALTGYATVGLLGAAATLASVLLAGRLLPARGGLEAIDPVDEPRPGRDGLAEDESTEAEPEPPLWTLPAQQAD
jgi:predicted MFS family arabinose efflux permease